MHRSQEAVASAGQRLDEPGVGGGVSDGLPQAVHRGVEAVVEIHVGVGAPQGLTQLLAGNHLPGAGEEDAQDFEGTPAERHPLAGLAQVARGQVCLERPEASYARGGHWIQSTFWPEV